MKRAYCISTILLAGFPVIYGCSLSSTAAAQTEGQQAAQTESRRAEQPIDVGKRQDPAKTTPNVVPMARVSQRLQTRIESRISNRLDRGAGSTASFAAANAQVQNTKPAK